MNGVVMKGIEGRENGIWCWISFPIKVYWTFTGILPFTWVVLVYLLFLVSQDTIPIVVARHHDIKFHVSYHEILAGELN